jgi:ferredoxin-fold anticodon binding domain-containing protein
VDLSAFVKYWLLFILADEVAVLKHMYSGTVHVEVLKHVVMRSSD